MQQTQSVLRNVLKKGGEWHSVNERFLKGLLQERQFTRERKIQSEVFLTSIFGNLLGKCQSGHLRLRAMDVHADMLVFQGFEGPDRSFDPGHLRE